MPRASQHGPLRPHALKSFFESNFNFKGFHKVDRITARAGTARGISGIITFGGKDPEATLYVIHDTLLPCSIRDLTVMVCDDAIGTLSKLRRWPRGGVQQANLY